MHSIIYEYGARIDTENRQAIYDQFNKARALYNNCIAIINDARKQADEYIKIQSPEVASQMHIIEHLNAAFDAAKAINDEDAMVDIVAERKKAYKELTPLLKSARKQHAETIKQIFEVIGLKKECLTYQARCHAVADGLGSATADDILATALKAWDKVRKDGGKLSFRSAAKRTQDHIINRFTCAGGVLASDLINHDNLMVNLKTPAEIKSKRYADFSFRLGAASAKQYATGTWQVDRPFPDGARISVIRLVKKRIGFDRDNYYLQFQLSIPELPAINVPENRKPLAVIHLGFSLGDNGYRRIGAIIDNADSSFAKFIDLPEDIPMDLFRVTQIQSRRDTARDNCHAAMQCLVPGNSWEDDIKQEWLDIAKLQASYVSSRRVCKLARQMQDRQYNNDAQKLIGDYAKKDWQDRLEQNHLQAKTLNRRKNLYRQWALDWVKQYEIIVISRYSLAEMALRIDKNGERNELGQIARGARHNAALYQLMDCLKWAAARAGSVVIEQTEFNYAHQCASCEQDFKRESDVLICECGHEADIKANAAARLFALKAETAAQEAELIKQSLLDKQQKAGEKKQDKLERMQSKRKLFAKANSVSDNNQSVIMT